MKWSKATAFRWFFALLPRKCIRCDHYFWMECGIKCKNRYGEVKRYCKGCAPHEWDGAKKREETT
jgi:hypothetical protein